MKVRPCELKDANAFVAALHRHHKPVTGHRFSIRVVDDDGATRGVAICGRPVARKTNQRSILEVTRLCTDGTPMACSKLYAAAARIAKETGYEMIQTFILDTEPGTTLRAAGWQFDGVTTGRSWSVPSRPREDKHPIELKQRWIRTLQ